MPQVKENSTIREYQTFIKDVYGFPNDRHFSTWDMLTNIERFLMRALKGIRKGNQEKIKINLIISLSWLTSLLNQLHIDIEEELWQRFPYLCSYCASCPCRCKETKQENRSAIKIDETRRPKNISEFQKMFREIYPPEKRSLEHAGVHLAEEMGELSEAILAYRGNRNDADFKNIELESADLVSCFIGVFNSLSLDIARELAVTFSNNCHKCKQAPCTCSFSDIVSFKS